MMTRLGLQYNASGEKRLIQSAFANIPASTTDGTLTLSTGGTLAAVAGKCYVVLGIFCHLQDATETNVTLNSKPAGSAGSAISSTKQVVANGGWVQTRGTEADYLYKTKRGEALTITTGTGSAVGVDVLFVLDDN